MAANVPNCTTCGRPEVRDRLPKSGCPECWVTFFKNHLGYTQQCAQLVKEEGFLALEASQGTRVKKNFLAFINQFDLAVNDLTQLAEPETIVPETATIGEHADTLSLNYSGIEEY